MSDMHGDAGEGMPATERERKSDYADQNGLRIKKAEERKVQEAEKKQSFSWVPAFLINLLPAYKYSRVGGTEDFGMCNRK
jgi:hypothetical protein